MVVSGIRDFANSLPSFLWSAPRPGAAPYLYDTDTVMLTTPSTNYTAADTRELLHAIGREDLVAQFEYLQGTGSLADFGAPTVNTWINYGIDVETPVRFEYDVDLSPGEAVTVTSDQVVYST